MAAPYAPFGLGKAWRTAAAVGSKPVTAAAMVGHQARFIALSLRAIPFALVTYPKHVLAHISSVVFGNGAIVVGGGTFGVMLILDAFAADSRRAAPPAACGEAIDVPLNIA